MQADVSIMKQALAVKAAVPGRRVFVYRNAVTALPFFSDARAKLVDPAYRAWFLPFGPPTVGNASWHVPQCDRNYNPPLCSTLYHGQVNTPQFPGQCAAPACDCGGIPCGEYLFDFRAANTTVRGQTLAEWFVSDYFFGPTALGHPGIDGLYVDDFWDAVHGPSEQDAHGVGRGPLASGRGGHGRRVPVGACAGGRGGGRAWQVDVVRVLQQRPFPVH
jgi:hypothetical protein